MVNPAAERRTSAPRITFAINHVTFFVSHRLPIALEARRRGYAVNLLTGQAGSRTMESSAEKTLALSGIEHRRVAFKSSGMNPVTEFWGLLQFIWLMYRYRPDLVHCASPKGLLYGGIAARLTGVRCLVLAVSGMGYAFSSTGQKSLARTIASKVYQSMARFVYAHPNKRIIVQNQDDERTLLQAGLAKPHEVVRIPGSGVELRELTGAVIEKKLPLILLPARMLVDKGVNVFVEAARHLKGRVNGWKFVLAGAADYQNPSSIPEAQLREWEKEGLVEWMGHVEAMAALYAQASIVCLPSSREGMPKSLLEAAAAGCAVVTTDAIGCREAIVPGVTGDLVPIRDSKTLAATLLSLIEDRERRERYGRAGRRLANERYSIDAVIHTTFDIYDQLLKAA